MNDRHRTRARSPIRDPARASLQSFNYGTYPELHAIPTRREIISSPRSSTDRSIPSPVVTTTYKITPDTSIPQRASSHRAPSRSRRSTLEGATRPTIINTPVARRNNPTARPSSPLSNPFRASDDGGIYTVPASSLNTRSSRHRPSYSTTIDNSDMNRASRESASGLLRAGSGRDGILYPQQTRSRHAEPQNLVRHADSMADDYGVNGYGYTNPRDVVQYDLARSAPKYSDERHDVYIQPQSRARPNSINSIQDVTPRTYDSRGGPPPSSRGFDRIPRQPVYEAQPTIRMPSIERSNRSEPIHEQKRRPQSMYLQDDRARPREREEYYDPRDDDLRREPKRTERTDRAYQDDVEGRGFGIRNDRSEPAHRNEPVPRAHDKKHEHDRRDERRSERRDDYDDRRDDKKKEKRSSGREALAAALSIGGAALGLSGLSNMAGGRGDSDRESDERDEPKRRRDEESRRKRETRDDDEVKESKDRHREDKGRRERREKEPEAIDLSGRNPQEKRPSKDQRDLTPPSSREDSPSTGDAASKPRRITSSVAPAFNPKDTMDLRALKEALNRQDGAQSEPVPIPVKSRDHASSQDSYAPSSFDPRDASSLASIKAELRSREADDMTTTARARGRTNSFLPVEATSDDPSSISIVSPPSQDESFSSSSTKAATQPVKGILRPPREKFPEEANPIREGVAPLKDSKKDGIPPDARWTKISRHMVNPEALELGKERFEAREDCVIVLRVLSKEEIQGYAEVTQKIRSMRPKETPRAIAGRAYDEDDEEEEDKERSRRRRDRHERHDRERERGERESKKSSSSGRRRRETRDRDRDADTDRIGDRSRSERNSNFSEDEESDTTEDDYVDLGGKRSKSRDRSSQKERDRRGVAFDEAKAGKDDQSSSVKSNLRDNGDGTYTGYVRNI